MVLGWGNVLLVHRDCSVDDLPCDSLLVDDWLDYLVNFDGVSVRLVEECEAYHGGKCFHLRLAQLRRIVWLAV